MNTFMNRWAHLLGAFLLAVALGVSGAPTASSDPNDTLGGSEKSIVFLLTKWTGSIQVPPDADAAGQGYWTKPLTSAVTCTGWYASASAQIVTAGHCVDPGEGRLNLIDDYLQDQNATNLKDQAYANWRVEGAMGGSPPDRDVRALQPAGVDGATITSPTTVEVVDFKPFKSGDVALLHVANLSKPTPGLAVAGNPPQVGDSVTSIGFPGDLQDITDQNQIARASFKAGTISSNQVTPSGISEFEVSTNIAPGMSGGPTVNKNGQVVGVNSSSLTTQAGFNFITNTPDLRSFLLSHNVALIPPPAPPKGNSATMMYIVGGLVLLLLVLGAVGTFLLLRRRKRTPQYAGAGGSPYSGYQMQGPPPSPVQSWIPNQPPQLTGPNSEPAAPPAPATTTADSVATSGSSHGTAPGDTTEHAGSEAVISETTTKAAHHFCASCGATLHPDDHFCQQCGKPVI